MSSAEVGLKVADLLQRLLQHVARVLPRACWIFCASKVFVELPIAAKTDDGEETAIGQALHEDFECFSGDVYILTVHRSTSVNDENEVKIGAFNLWWLGLLLLSIHYEFVLLFFLVESRCKRSSNCYFFFVILVTLNE